jgi:hypothetical protein
VTFGPVDDSDFPSGQSGRRAESGPFGVDPDEDDVFRYADRDEDSELDGDADLDGLPAAEHEYHTALPPKLEAWRRRSATGAILTGFALGLQEALETKRQEPAIVMQTSGDPPRDLPVEADFEYGRPRQSVVSIRPWLLEGSGPERESEGDGPPTDDEAGSAPR